MKKLSFPLILIFLSSCQGPGPAGRNPQSQSSSAPAATEVGNGGDVSPITFKLGQSFATALLKRVDFLALPEAFLEVLLPGEAALLEAKRAELIAAIEAVEPEWMFTMPAGCPDHKCGCSKEGRLYLSYLYCRDEDTPRKAAAVHIHEAIHRVLKDKGLPEEEKRAIRLSAGVEVAWMNLGHPHRLHWQSASTSDMVRRNYPVWAKNRIYTFDEALLTSYDPATDSVTMEEVREPEGNIDDVLGHTDALIAVRSCHEKQKLPLLSKLELTSGKKAWKSLEVSGVSPERDRADYFLKGGVLMAYGGLACENDPSKLPVRYDGYFLPLATGKASEIREYPPLQNRSGDARVAMDGKLFVWGGFRNTESGKNYLASGAVFDIGRAEWQQASQSPLSPRSEPVAVALDKRTLIVGGNRDSLLLSDGAIYDPESLQWKGIAAAPLAMDRSSVTATWTGLKAYFIGRDFLAVYDTHYDKWEMPQRLIHPELSTPLISFLGELEIVVWGELKTFLLYQ